MIKKAIFVLSALIALAVNASAQQTGSWHYYPLYAGQPDKVEVADNGTVYYLSAGRLYSFDGEENRDFVNDFSGRKITYMKYNADADYLFVARLSRRPHGAPERYRRRQSALRENNQRRRLQRR